MKIFQMACCIGMVWATLCLPVKLYAFYPDALDLDYVHPMVVPLEKQPTQEQLDALEALNQVDANMQEKSELEYEVVWSHSTGNPMLVVVSQPIPVQGSYETTARHALNSLKDLYNFLDPNQNFNDLELACIEELPPSPKTKLAGKEYRLQFEQYSNGLRVEGGEMTVHLFERLGVYYLHGNYYTDIVLSSFSSVPVMEETAVDLALFDLEELGFHKVGEAQAKLVIYPLMGNYFLAYKVSAKFFEEEGDFVLFVDAASGEILSRQNQISFINGTGDLFVHHSPHWNNVEEGEDNCTNEITHAASVHTFSQDIPLTNLTQDAEGKCILKNGNVEIINGEFSFSEDDYTHVSEADCTFEYPAANEPNSRISEVLGYYHLNKFRDWLLPLFDDPNDPDLDYFIPVIVNYRQANQASYYPSEDLIRMGGGLRSDDEDSDNHNPNEIFLTTHNTARDESILYHEYFHSMNRHMLISSSNPTPDDVDLALGIKEGLADYFSNTFRNDSIEGAYILDQKCPNFSVGFPPRDANHTWIYPDDAPIGDENEEHVIGHIYIGALWDFREEFTVEGLPSDMPDKIILRHIYYLTEDLPETTVTQVMNTLENSLSAMLVSADNGNADEHRNRIKTCFCRHNIGLSYRSPVINGEIYYPRNQTPPTFENWFGFQDDGYKIQIATNTILFSSQFQNQRTSSNWYESSILTIPQGLSTGPSKCVGSVMFTMPQSNWNSMKSASKFYYRVISYINAFGQWTSPVYSTPTGSDPGIMPGIPIMNINTTGIAQ